MNTVSQSLCETKVGRLFVNTEALINYFREMCSAYSRAALIRVAALINNRSFTVSTSFSVPID